MRDISSVVVSALMRQARGRRIKVGILYRGNISLVESIAKLGFRTIVFGDRFRSLYRLQRRIVEDGYSPFAITETRMDELPLARWSLDVLVLTRGLPASEPPEEALSRLRSVIAPGGIMIWLSPLNEGVNRLFLTIGFPYRIGIAVVGKKHELCRCAMNAGFKEVGQTVVKGEGPFSWVLTSGTAGQLPIGWRLPLKKVKVS